MVLALFALRKLNIARISKLGEVVPTWSAQSNITGSKYLKNTAFFFLRWDWDNLLLWLHEWYSHCKTTAQHKVAHNPFTVPQWLQFSHSQWITLLESDWHHCIISGESSCYTTGALQSCLLHLLHLCLWVCVHVGVVMKQGLFGSVVIQYCYGRGWAE